MKKLDHILKFCLDIVVIASITILAYFDKLPREVIVGVLGMYAGAYAQQRRANGDKDGKGGDGGGASAAGIGATTMVLAVAWSLLSSRQSVSA